jgi:hypothetical protein
MVARCKAHEQQQFGAVIFFESRGAAAGRCAGGGRDTSAGRPTAASRRVAAAGGGCGRWRTPLRSRTLLATAAGCEACSIC